MNSPFNSKAPENHIAVLGKTGSGKSSTARLIIEQVAKEGDRVCVLDPVKSDWWGITSSADGKSAGLPFSILGGPHGHVGLHASAGKAIGQLVGSGALAHSIIDMADFEAGGLQKFFVDFAGALMRSARGVTYLVIEEAHEFAPKERAGFNAENMALFYAKKLATAGRSKGIRLIVATQRVQSLHNAVLGSCETLVVHRLTAPADQKPVLDWLRANGDKARADQVASELASLPTGTAWVCSGEVQMFKRIAFEKFGTYDNTKTPTRSSGGDIAVTTAPVDLAQLKTLIGDAAQDAVANDPKALKAEIARLQKQNAFYKQSDSGKTDQAYKSGYDTGKMHGDNLVAGQAYKDGYQDGFKDAASRTASGLSDAITAAIKLYEPPRPSTVPPLPNPARSPSAGNTVEGRGSAPNKAPLPAAGQNLSGPQQKIMRALMFWASTGQMNPSREQVAAIAQYSAVSGSFRNTLSSLKTAGLIDYPSEGTVTALPGSGWYDTMLHDEARSILLSRLAGPQLRVVHAVTPRGQHDREDVAARAGYEPISGSFRNTLSSLRTMDVIDYPSSGQVKLTAWAREILEGGQ